MRSSLRKIEKTLSNFRKDLSKRKLSRSWQTGKWFLSPLIRSRRRSANPGSSGSSLLYIQHGTNSPQSSYSC